MNRTFKNEKGKVVDAPPDAPLDLRIQKQVDSMMKLHEEARGPSLMASIENKRRRRRWLLRRERRETIGRGVEIRI